MVGPTLPHWTCSSAWELEDVERSEQLLLEVEGAAEVPLEVAPCMSRPVLFRFPMTPVLQMVSKYSCQLLVMLKLALFPIGRWKLWASYATSMLHFGQRFIPILFEL